MGPDAYPEEWTQEEILEHERWMAEEIAVDGEWNQGKDGSPSDDEEGGPGCGRRTPSQVGCADSASGRPSGDTAHAARSREESSFNDPKEGPVGSLVADFVANRVHLDRTRAIGDAMQAHVESRMLRGVAPQDDPFAYSSRELEAERAEQPKGLFVEPIFGERVYAVADRLGRSEKFLGYSDDPDTTEKILALSDAWRIVRRPEVQDSISDEWLGRAPLPPTAPEKVAEEREAWDDYEFAKTHREQVAEERFEYRGRDARGGFADADERSRRQRADVQLQMELERGAEVLGDERHRQALRERKRFRAYIEAFGQDPDAPEIVAWRESKTYAACNAQLRAKALKDGVLLPSVA